ncbi:MAG: dicarboxylate/amino acid:cation symporter [Puniceicoccales bacterium]|jgi:Na+/H+-dicarboxylate symporter|nr:dicarboxylate/amino acid:cation symporter [Puniceicoccales bacterium]
MFKKMPFLLLLLIVFVFSFGQRLPTELLQFLLAVSVTLKAVIMFLLPIIIFSLLFCAFRRIGANASSIIGLTLVMVCISNFFTTFVGHFIGEAVYGVSWDLSLPSGGRDLNPLFNFQLPKLIPNIWAMAAGIIGGICASKLPSGKIIPLTLSLDRLVAHILHTISLTIPLLLLGFLLKMQYDGQLTLLVRQYASVIAIIICALMTYLFAFYWIASGFSARRALASLRNMFPAVVCAFGSMSSAAALPYTIAAVAKNTINKPLARSIVSATTNIHLVGDCIIDMVLIYAILRSYHFVMPSQLLFLTFALQSVFAKFSVAAIPGGGIVVVLPIIERVFGFNGAMASLIFSMYLILDPFATTANVLGNGAFAQLMDRLLGSRMQKHLNGVVLEENELQDT